MSTPHETIRLRALGWDVVSCYSLTLSHRTNLYGTDHQLGLRTVPKPIFWIDPDDRSQGVGQALRRRLFHYRHLSSDGAPTTPDHPRWHRLMAQVRQAIAGKGYSHAYQLCEDIDPEHPDVVLVSLRGALLRVRPLSAP